MAFGISKTSEADSLLIVHAEDSAESNERRAQDDDAPLLTLLDTLRDVLARQGIRESVSSEEEGFYFVIEGRGEVSLQYHGLERKGSLPNAMSLRRHEIGLLKCCAELAPYGHTLTLVLSPRTLALHVRFE